MTSPVPPIIGPQPPPIPIPMPCRQPPVIPSPTPGVLFAFRIWCGLIAFLHLAVLVYCVLVSRGIVEPATGLFEELTTPQQGPERDKLIAEKRQEWQELQLAVVPGSAAAAIFYCFAGFVPRKKWGWKVGLGAIVGSIFPFVVTWVGIVPLLILWCKTAAKRYFSCPV